MLEIDSTTWQTPNKDPKPITPQGILLHSTEGSALSSLRWLTNPKSKVSSNYVIDEHGRIFQLAKDTERTWHGGAGTWDGITDLNTFLGIELVHKRGQGAYPQAQIDSLIALCRLKIEEYGFPQSRITLHRWAAKPKGRKQDPTDLSDEQARAWITRMFAPTKTVEYGVRQYRVLADGSALRTKPDRSGDVVLRMAKGEIFPAIEITFGEVIGGENGWMLRADSLGWCHESLLEEII